MENRKMENKTGDWTQQIAEYLESSEGKEVIKNITDCLDRRSKAVNEISSIMKNFIKSEEFDKFWKDRNKGDNEKVENTEVIQFFKEKSPPELLGYIKSAAVNHLTISFLLNNLSSNAINLILDNKGYHLLNDCIKETGATDGGNFFAEFFNRIEKICFHFSTSIMDMFTPENPEPKCDSIVIENNNEKMH